MPRVPRQEPQQLQEPPIGPPTPPVFIVAPTQKGPNLLVRFLWFLFVGWWAGQLVVLLAWLLNLTIIGLPLGLWLLNRLPQVFTLRPETKEWRVSEAGEGGTAWVAEAVSIPQRPLLWRALYFVLIGWWFSLLWLEAAWLLGLSIIGLPLSFLMFSKSAAVTTLRRT
jgi:uncharacterized membrane protein YccF (DUF307 family)